MPCGRPASHPPMHLLAVEEGSALPRVEPSLFAQLHGLEDQSSPQGRSTGIAIFK